MMGKQSSPKREFRDEAEWRKRPRLRDSQGRYAGPNVFTDAERQRRRERERQLQRQESDHRTRISRRVRAIENELRNQLRRQNRPITIDIDITVGQTASAVVRVEAYRSQMSRGLAIDDASFRGLLNIAQRGLAKLGLKPGVLDDGERSPRGQDAAQWRREEQARKAAETATSTMEPPDGRAA